MFFVAMVTILPLQQFMSLILIVQRNPHHKYEPNVLYLPCDQVDNDHFVQSRHTWTLLKGIYCRHYDRYMNSCLIP